MIIYPKTKAKARTYRYGAWAGGAYHEGDCAYPVPLGCDFFQCSRRNGKGPGGLYCKQHAKMIPENQDGQDKRN